MSLQTEILAAGALLIVVFVTGFVLHRATAPYPTALLTAHKLLSLATAVLLGIAVFGAQREAPLPGGTWASLLATALFFFTAVATGGIISTDKPALPVISILHKVAPWFTVLSSVMTVYLLVG